MTGKSAKKKAAKKAAPRMVAAANIAIGGQHFDRGEEITGVDAELLSQAVGARRVVSEDELAGKGE